MLHLYQFTPTQLVGFTVSGETVVSAACLIVRGKNRCPARASLRGVVSLLRLFPTVQRHVCLVN